MMKKFRKRQWVKTLSDIALASNSTGFTRTCLGVKSGIVGQITGTPYRNFDGYFTVLFELPGGFYITRDMHQNYLEKAQRP